MFDSDGGDADSERMGFDDPAGQPLSDLGIGLDLGQRIGLYLVVSPLRVLDDNPAPTLGHFGSISGERTLILHRIDSL